MRSTSRDLKGREGKEAQEQGRLCARRPGRRHLRVLATALALPPPRAAAFSEGRDPAASSPSPCPSTTAPARLLGRHAFY